MKTLITTIILLYSFVAKSQAIEGIGMFKIKKTTVEDVFDYAYKNYFTKKNTTLEFGENEYQSDTYDFIIEIQPDTINVNDSHTEASFCKNERVIYLSKYKIYDIELKNLYLRFKNDTLYQLKSDFNDKLSKSLVAQFGKAKEKNESIQSKCFYVKNNKKIYYKDSSNTFIWANGENIMTVEIYTFRFKLENCVPNYSFYFKVKNAIIQKEISDCSEQMKILAKENSSKNRLKQLFEN